MVAQVVEVFRARSRGLDLDMFAVQGTNAIWELPPLFEVFGNFLPIFGLARTLKKIRNGVNYASKNALYTLF